MPITSDLFSSKFLGSISRSWPPREIDQKNLELNKSEVIVISATENSGSVQQSDQGVQNRSSLPVVKRSLHPGSLEMRLRHLGKQGDYSSYLGPHNASGLVEEHHRKHASIERQPKSQLRRLYDQSLYGVAGPHYKGV